jgi:hypothetical protein
VYVLGTYGTAAPPPAPAGAPGGCPAIGGGAAAAGAPPALTLGGEPAAVEAVAAGPALGVPGFVAVRCHCDVTLRVTAPPGGATPAALTAAADEAARQVAPEGLALISDERCGGGAVGGGRWGVGGEG